MLQQVQNVAIGQSEEVFSTNLSTVLIKFLFNQLKWPFYNCRVPTATKMSIQVKIRLTHRDLRAAIHVCKIDVVSDSTIWENRAVLRALRTDDNSRCLHNWDRSRANLEES